MELSEGFPSHTRITFEKKVFLNKLTQMVSLLAGSTLCAFHGSYSSHVGGPVVGEFTMCVCVCVCVICVNERERQRNMKGEWEQNMSQWLFELSCLLKMNPRSILYIPNIFPRMGREQKDLSLSLSLCCGTAYTIDYPTDYPHPNRKYN